MTNYLSFSEVMTRLGFNDPQELLACVEDGVQNPHTGETYFLACETDAEGHMVFDFEELYRFADAISFDEDIELYLDLAWERHLQEKRGDDFTRGDLLAEMFYSERHGYLAEHYLAEHYNNPDHRLLELLLGETSEELSEDPPTKLSPSKTEERPSGDQIIEDFHKRRIDYIVEHDLDPYSDGFLDDLLDDITE
ncbi:hypothetical protein [Picosynechococcus sp. PCC 7117]|uniref:hypothetical protein n=1 Tax=Picosynechococcus sp. PCC 7117 TaxID=195498 RepID=UPI00081073A0|nr:hypothetical protein [Picosynechococcus sp. PCC 7117]ANV88480.1 hypothetical protein AWQ22_13990 [Picosynechococcus sp. PCC 7117]